MIFKKTFIIIVLLSTVLLPVGLIHAQSDDAGVLRDVFLAARDTFFDNQTTANQQVYVDEARRYGLAILDAQEVFISSTEVALFSQLRIKNTVPQNWLEQEKTDLGRLRSDLQDATNYARIQSIMRDTAVFWENVEKKIQQMRVWVAFDQYDVVLRNARSIHDALLSAQVDVEQQLQATGVADVDFTPWRTVFDTYSEKLVAIEDSFIQERGAFTETDYTTLDAEDTEWQQDVEYLQELSVDMRALSQLQEASINQFLASVSAFVVPVTN